MNTKYTIPDELSISDVETLKAIAHPQRLAIIRTLDTPKTVKEIADNLDADPTKLYYHVNLLEKQELITVVATNVVSGIIEKQYLAAAKRISVDQSLVSEPAFQEEHLESVVTSLLDSTKETVLQGLRNGLISLPTSESDSTEDESPKNDPQKTFMATGYTYHLTVDQVDEFQNELDALFTRYEEIAKENDEEKDQKTKSDDTHTYQLTIVLCPTGSPNGRSQAGEQEGNN